jgi:hypothetical protein
MATNTTRLGLIKPDFVDVVDISELNTNADDIDAAVGAAVVTSATRPSAPWTGQIIHETDTDLTLVWDGVAWVSTGGADLENLGDVDITSAESGDTLVYDGSDWVNQPLTTHRNLFFNGAMQVVQRGTSTTGITGTGYFTADRWLTGVGTMGTWTQTVENDGPTGSGFRKSFKILCTTADASPAAGDFVNIRQPLEGQNIQSIRKGTSEAKQLTMSFWVKANVTGTYIVELNDLNNTRVVAAPYSILTSGTWEKKTLVFPADTTGVFSNDNAASLRPQFWLGAGSDFTSGTLATSWESTTNANRAVGQVNLAAATNNYWQITGVQLEVGPVATPFEFKSFGQELLECQRYYYRLASDLSGRRFATGYNTTTTGGYHMVPFPTTMRTVPSALEQSGTASDYGINHGNFSVTNLNAVPTYGGAFFNNGMIISSVASGLTAGQGSFIVSNNADAFLAWSAEL